MSARAASFHSFVRKADMADNVDSHHVHFTTVSDADAGQRVDNFLRKRYPGLPRSRVYQMLRRGEVRRNKKRVTPSARLCAGDLLRLPPIVAAARADNEVPAYWRERIARSVCYEDGDFLILDKPAGIAVHGGSTQRFGVIDAVRRIWGTQYAELAHRLDRETSGVLVLGKNRSALAGFQTLMHSGDVEKRYWTLVCGTWACEVTQVGLHLEKTDRGGEHRMTVVKEGRYAHSRFRILQNFADATLLEVLLDTGRTHQIRVSTAFLGHAVAGDRKYGDPAFNEQVSAKGFRGMFLHAREIRFTYGGRSVCVAAPLPQDAQALLDQW